MCRDGLEVGVVGTQEAIQVQSPTMIHIPDLDRFCLPAAEASRSSGAGLLPRHTAAALADANLSLWILSDFQIWSVTSLRLGLLHCPIGCSSHGFRVYRYAAKYPSAQATDGLRT